MTLHILRVPTHVTFERDDGSRWCFYCRKHVGFIYRVHTPDDPMSYYGPHPSLTCEHGHLDGDCFPGTWHEWDDPDAALTGKDSQ